MVVKPMVCVAVKVKLLVAVTVVALAEFEKPPEDAREDVDIVALAEFEGTPDETDDGLTMRNIVVVDVALIDPVPELLEDPDEEDPVAVPDEEDPVELEDPVPLLGELDEPDAVTVAAAVTVPVPEELDELDALPVPDEEEPEEEEDGDIVDVIVNMLVAVETLVPEVTVVRLQERFH